MLTEFVAPFRRIVQALVASHTPSELAAGFTLGMIIGLVPKSNLIALSLCVLLFSLRVNKGMGLAAGLTFACFATSLDPFAHQLGLTVLSAAPLQVSYTSIYGLPLGPWIGFNNTVTCGAFLIGLYVAYPVYFASHVIFAFVARRMVAWLESLGVFPQETGDEIFVPPRAAA